MKLLDPIDIPCWLSHEKMFYRVTEAWYRSVVDIDKNLTASFTRLDGFIPLTTESMYTLGMCHPRIDISQLEICELAWRHGRIIQQHHREWYRWNAIQSCWD